MGDKDKPTDLISASEELRGEIYGKFALPYQKISFLNMFNNFFH